MAETTPTTSEASAEDIGDKVRRLEPEQVSFKRLPGGELVMTISGEATFSHVFVRCAFPVTRPGTFVEIRDSEGERIGMLESLDQLGKEDAKLLQNALHEQYFVPMILDIVSVHEVRGFVQLDVATDRGDRVISLSSLRHSVRFLSPERLRFTDVEGNCYDLDTRRDFSRTSRHLLEAIT